MSKGSLSLESYLAQEIARMRGPFAPDILARRFVHQHRLPWESVTAICSLLDMVSGQSMPRFETDDEYWWAPTIDASAAIANLFGKCQSPIEELFLAYAASGDLVWPGDEESIIVRGVTVTPQAAAVGRYRADFLFQGPELRLAVECDGHDFHERTKAQAARDKSRDRAFLDAGIVVMRFTGSEIWKDPQSCVKQAFARAGRPL